MAAIRLKLLLSERALQDLEGIFEWYAQQQAEQAGRRELKSILKAVERLERFPLSGRVIPEFEVASLREIITAPWRIAYRLSSGKVEILAVRRSSRLIKAKGSTAAMTIQEKSGGAYGRQTVG